MAGIYQRCFAAGKAICQNRDGGVAPLLALAAIPLFASIGVGIDYARAGSIRTAMQSSLDATALIVSREVHADFDLLKDRAREVFIANFTRTDSDTTEISASRAALPNGSSVSLSASSAVKTNFMGILGISSIPLSARTTAILSSDGLGCVLSLDPQADGATTGQGTSSVILNGCSLYDNSAHETALAVGGTAKIEALSVGVVGNISGSSNIVTSQGIRTGIATVVDPYAKVSFSRPFGCTEQNFSAKTTITINPGVYCGGMTINAGAKVTLSPGVYYIDGGSFFVNGGASVVGTGVTIIFTAQNRKDWPSATVNGSAIIDLRPPLFGETAGIVLFGDRRIPNSTTFKFNGGSSQYFGGAIYLPTAEVTFAGGLSTSTSCTQLIANRIVFTGKSEFALNCSNYGTKPFSSVTLRLAS